METPAADTPLLQACRAANAAEIFRILRTEGVLSGPPPAGLRDVADPRLQQPLLLAVTKVGDAQCVEALLRAGASANATDREGWTPLHEAADGGPAAAVQALLDAGADVKAVDSSRWTALHWAAGSGSSRPVSVGARGAAHPLISRRSHRLQRFEMPSVWWGSAPWATRVTISVYFCFSACWVVRVTLCRTVLSRASSAPYFVRYAAPQVKLLLEHGANVNAVDIVRNTPLHFAAKYGCRRVVKLLLQAGAPVDAKDVHAHTPLSIAALRGHVSVMQILIRAGASLHPKLCRGITPLHLACEGLRPAAACFLAAHG